LKARFARPCDFYENLRERHLPKIGTISARLAIRERGCRRGASCTLSHEKMRDGRCAMCGSHVRERIVHHATDRSPCNPPFTILCEWTRALMRILPLATRKYRCPACLSVRLSGV
jgi:hypothetical protein